MTEAPLGRCTVLSCLGHRPRVESRLEGSGPVPSWLGDLGQVASPPPWLQWGELTLHDCKSQQVVDAGCITEILPQSVSSSWRYF